ncbi:protein kinase [Candidatus Woesearchaeota archaeon]|nr:protein kinase [Candidatus Woesearchaeota archaeon]
MVETKVKSGLEKIIDSDRYKIKNFLGRGCWGSVYEAFDAELERAVAIKIWDPNETAAKQMVERNLDIMKAAKKEAQELSDCANVVPRKFETDANGKPFIVMPLYEKFLSDILAEEEGKTEGEYYINHIPHKRLESGLFLADLIKYARDMASGIEEIHSAFGRAHCDIKPDNIAVGRDGKLLISDLGTSTYASMGCSESPRDNMGYIYTRAPQMFFEGVHPDRSCDIYSFGSLLYKMFTGKYIFQDELDKAMKKGKKGIQDFFLGLGDVSKFTQRKQYWHNNKMAELVKRKLENKNIPEEFKRIIEESVLEKYRDGSVLKNALQSAIELYNESLVKKKFTDELKKNLKSKAKGWFVGGTALAALTMGGAWVTYFSPKPDFSNRPEMEMQIMYRKPENCDIKLEVEKEPSAKVSKVGNANHDSLAEYSCMVFRDKTLLDEIVAEYVGALKETGAEVDTMEIAHRYSIMGGLRGTETGNSEIFHNRHIKGLLEAAFQLNQVKGGAVDLEDALTMAIVGTQKMREAQKAANSCDFYSYISAKDENGSCIIPEDQQELIKRTVYRVIKRFADKIVYKPSSAQKD